MKQVSKTINSTLALVPVVLLAGGIAACSDATVGGGAASQLSFMASTTTASASAATLVPITNAGHTLDLTQVTLTLSRVELKRTQGDACKDDVDGEHEGETGTVEDCAEVKVGPTSVDLPLAGGLVTLPANTIPAGTFRELELRVSDVRLRGTFDAAPFDVTLPVGVRGEIEFSTPLVVTDGAATSITVNVPVSGWLVNSDGSLIPPNQILASSTLMAVVRSRIAASFRAFEDSDHDGKDDHGGHD